MDPVDYTAEYPPEVQRVQVCVQLSYQLFCSDAFCTGKTLLARTLAKVLDVPFSVSDANSFTQVGNSILQQT